MHFRDRAPEQASLLIGADGIHSAVRAALWGIGETRYCGQTCYRGIAEFAPPDPHVLREVQGAGKRAAVCSIDRQRAYWWAALNAPAGQVDDPAARQKYLLEQFKGWPYHIPEAIAATTGPILRNDLIDRVPMKRWSRGRATLLGDAAHPMLPNPLAVRLREQLIRLTPSTLLARTMRQHIAYDAGSLPRSEPD